MIGHRAFWVVCVAMIGSSSSSTSTGTSGGGGNSSNDGGSVTFSGSCDTDPLKTGLVAMQTGISVDSFDCQILKWSAKNNEPDPMLFKAIIYVESRFDATSVGCTNMPCGMPMGWSSDETGCFGLMQIVPACGGAPNAPGLLANGQPDLVKDMSNAGWSGSVFNPDVNIEIGIAGFADNRAQEMKKFPGCSADQYTMMAMGDYNSYGSTKSCTEINTDYSNLVLPAYKQYATAAGYTPHSY